MAVKHLKKYSTPSVIREMQTKRCGDSNLYQSEWLRSKIQLTIYADEDVEKEEHSCTAVRIKIWNIYFGKQYDGSS